MRRRGDLLEKLYLGTGEYMNERQRILMNLTDEKQIASYLLTRKVDLLKEDFFNKGRQFSPLAIIAMGLYKSDKLNGIRPTVYDKRNAIMEKN